MSLIKLENVSLAFGHHHLLDRSSLSVEHKQRLCVVGRNGAGKSSLLKLINREILPDDGHLVFQDGLKVTKLDQDVPGDLDETVYEFVVQGVGELAALIIQYHDALLASEEAGHTDSAMQKLFSIQHELDARQGWDFQRDVDSIISKLELPSEKKISELSGGWRRRALLAQALVASPDVLLLDEPTNHLDIEAITWLEDFLLSEPVTLLFISHDRRFIKRLATDIIDLDRGKLTLYPGDFDKYLEQKAHDMEVEQQQNAEFDKHLADEEVWIRQGIKARRTRNEGRVRRLKALRQERAGRRERTANVDFNLANGEGSGKIVFEAENISYGWDGQTLIKNFSTRVMRGDRIGLIGPNGTGKSSLLKILLGDLEANSGNVKRGSKQVVAYFDQQRAQLDPEKNLIDNVIDGSEMITINGSSRHVISYLKDFLFAPERMHSPVKTLSGGETNRLLLARLFSKPANILVLDEPTNDLDMETLDLLENILMEFDGTILMVTHDREFLDNVVTSLWVFEGEGIISEHVGGYTDYQSYLKKQKAPAKEETISSVSPKTNDKVADAVEKKKTKLSYKEQRELESLPQQIEALEIEQNALHEIMASADFYQLNVEEQKQKQTRLEEVETALEQAFTRWEELDSF